MNVTLTKILIGLFLGSSMLLGVAFADDMYCDPANTYDLALQGGYGSTPYHMNKTADMVDPPLNEHHVICVIPYHPGTCTVYDQTDPGLACTYWCADGVTPWTRVIGVRPLTDILVGAGSPLCDDISLDNSSGEWVAVPTDDDVICYIECSHEDAFADTFHYFEIDSNWLRRISNSTNITANYTNITYNQNISTINNTLTSGGIESTAPIILIIIALIFAFLYIGHKLSKS